jgi:hypothetical protein
MHHQTQSEMFSESTVFFGVFFNKTSMKQRQTPASNYKLELGGKETLASKHQNNTTKYNECIFKTIL